jgi:glycosyltransferase involved in cell wall biosynthesis
MKILMTIPAVGPVYGGTSKAVLELSEALGHTGITVDVVTTNLNGDQPLDVPTDRWVEGDGYRIRYFAHGGGAKYIFNNTLLQWMEGALGEYDVIHLNTLFAPMISLAAWHCRRRGKPFVMTPHGMLDAWALRYKAWKKKPYFACIEKPLLDAARGIQTITSIESGQVKKLGIRATPFLVPNGIHIQSQTIPATSDLFFATFPQLKGKRIVLFLSRIDPKKGLDRFIPAFARVRGTIPDAALVIAGPDLVNYKPAVEQFLAEHGCADAALFPGMIGGELKRSALAAADVYILPSYSEGMSMSILEAMACGLPCVFTTGCGFPEADTARAARVVEPEIELLAEAVADLLAHPDDARAMGDRARNFIQENYTWQRAAEKMSAAYDVMLAAPGGR